MTSSSETELLLAHVLRRITPSENERKELLSLADRLVKRVEKAAENAKVKATVRLEGSVARDTWLSGEPEIDIFLQLPKATPRQALGTVCLSIAREATKGSRQVERFAEHPYLEAFVNSTRVNIVPCYKAKTGEWLSATDRTPHHTNFVKPRLNDHLKSQIRLLKRFMKGIDIYGAEIKVGGFSGYLCELLTLQYGTFMDVMRAAASMNKPWIIDYVGYYRKKKEDLPKIFEEPLIMVDPVDKGRNVASAVRQDRLVGFVAASRQFLQNPTEQFFFPQPTRALSPDQLLKRIGERGTALVFLIIGEVKAVPDILWGQLYKTQRSLRNMLSRNEFCIVNDAVWSNEADSSVLLFEVEARSLSPIRKHFGPPIEKRAECERFLRKHLGAESTVAGPRLEDARWVVETKRKYTDVVDLLRRELKHGGRQVGVAELISKVVANKVNVFVNEEVISIYEGNRGFAEFLTEYLDGKPKWLVHFQ